MNVMPYVQRLKAAGFSGEILDRAVAMAGANCRIYLALCQAVRDGMRPEKALESIGTVSVKSGWAGNA